MNFFKKILKMTRYGKRISMSLDIDKCITTRKAKSSNMENGNMKLRKKMSMKESIIEYLKTMEKDNPKPRFFSFRGERISKAIFIDARAGKRLSGG